MATTAYAVGDPLAVKLWSKKLFHEALKETWASKFMGKSSNSLCQIMEDTSKGPGDRVRVPLRLQLAGGGIEGDGTLEGNEEALSTSYDDLLVNMLRHAVRSEGKMSEQRVPFSVREEARMGLQDWWAGRIDTAFFNQLCGNTGQTDTRYTGHNATIAPTSTRYVWPDAASSNTEADVASNTASAAFNLKLIDKCVEKAKTATPMIRPIRINGQDKYVMFLHPYQVYDLRTSTTTGQWLDIQKAVVQGGGENMIYNGALGEYNGVILHESTRVASVTANVYRAVFCGAQALIMGYGQESSSGRMSWVEELFDYKNQLGVSAGMIWGMKKASFSISGTATDFGTIVAPTYAVAH